MPAGGHSSSRTNKKKQDQVTLVEVSPRDGLPLLGRGLSTDDKVSYINKLSETGLTKIECATFTHPRLLPAGYDAEKLIEGISKKPSVTYVGLVPNEIGCRRAVITKLDEILILLAASDIFNKINLGRTLKETLNKMLPAILDTAAETGRSTRVYIMTAFGCPYTGAIPTRLIEELVLKLSHMGVSEISLVDSTGMANPGTVRSTIDRLMDLQLNMNLAVHFHDTRGVAIANCVAAYESGVRIFDTSLGGMSATPYGVEELDFGYWNVPTEDLVHLFEEMGISTGVELDLLLDCVKLAEHLAGRPLPGHLLRAHPASRIAAIPEHLTRRSLLNP